MKLDVAVLSLSLCLTLPIVNHSFQIPPSSTRRCHRLSETCSMARKPGVAEPEEIRALIESAGDQILVIDTRNPNADESPGDQESAEVGPFPSDSQRPRAILNTWNRTIESLNYIPDVPKDTHIITHCGGGGRGLRAKELLEANGFTNVLNGGGPLDAECWAEFGEL